MERRLLLVIIPLTIGLLGTQIVLVLHMRQEARWNGFIHCRLTDLEDDGKADRNCILEGAAE